MFTLKTYQAQALEAVERFFRRMRIAGRDAAWTEVAVASTGRPYDPSALGEVPAVCIRIPTGGGKTVLAAHAIPRIGQAFDTDAPVALWLVPSEAIRSQTLAALKSPGHPCRSALEQAFGDRLRVCGLEDLPTVGRHEVGTSAIVIVATIQSFNVKDKSIRNVYAFDEALDAHFQALTPQQLEKLDKVTEADLAAQPYLTQSDVGRVKSSLANFLALARPVIVVDEAHNNRTDQAFRTLRNLNPACVVELTATPAKGSNVLFHVGAQALQREEMIKLPIVLMEHPTGWKDAVRDAILTRDRLEHLAAKEDEYLRPVVLFQAQPKNGEVTVEVLLEHLTSSDGEKIDRKQIAVATGDQKELGGIVLADRACPIRYVITVEALKEGWDCPFAYVLCGLQDTRSAKDVEQLLGRVLRMPYARARQQPELNRAYAHVVKQGFVDVASQLVDRLVQNMGFNAYEAAAAIVAPSEQLPLPGTPGVYTPPAEEAYVQLPSVPAITVPEALREKVEIRELMGGGAAAVVRGELTDEVAAFLLEGVASKDKDTVRASIDQERVRQEARRAPGARGIPFAPLPQLCVDFEGALQPLDKRLLAVLGEFDLFAEPIGLAGFNIRESANVIEIDVDDDRVTYSQGEAAQLQLNMVTTHWTVNDLVRWLDRECRQPDVAQASLVKWLLKTVDYLRNERGFHLTALVRGRHQLKEATTREIERRRRAAATKGFQAQIPNFLAAPRLEDSFRYAFTFHGTNYAGRPPFYRGAYKFKKHYYPGMIHDLREKTEGGKDSEEFICARAIDMHPQVKHWIRNVERESLASFWLPTSTDLFYPDFVAELTDGRLLVVEYKGEHLATADDTREKAQIGHQWEVTSEGRCLFLLATARDEQGRDVRQQLDDKIAGR